MRYTLSEPSDLDVRPGKYTVTILGSGVILDHNQDCLWVGGGGFRRQRVTFVVPGDHITICPEPVMVVEVPALRSLDHEGWLNEPSLTDLSPRPFGSISPEMQAVIDLMNRNAIAREQAMLRALGNRQAQ